MVRAKETRLAYSTGGEREPPPLPDPTPATGIRIRLERRASDRLVTLVSGLPGKPAEVQALARELKTTCGTGGTYRDGALELQGDHRDRVERALGARGLRSKRAGGSPG
jgi:translation initiation factor 1